MSWAAELLTELCRAGSHLHLHPWRCIVKSRVLRISGAFLLFFFFVPAVLTIALPVLHGSQLSKANSFTLTGSNPLHHWFALSPPRSPPGGTRSLCHRLPAGAEHAG